MAYCEFILPEAIDRFGLTLIEASVSKLVGILTAIDSGHLSLSSRLDVLSSIPIVHRGIAQSLWYL